MKTDRRKFIESTGLGLSGMFLSGKLTETDFSPEESHDSNFLQTHMVGNPYEVKLNVKLLYYASIHSTTWEGPCRYEEMKGPDVERIEAKESFNVSVKEFKNSLGKDVNFLEPLYFEFPENARIGREDIVKLEEDKEVVDLYIIRGYQLGSHPETYFASVLADNYKKPIVPSSHYGRTTSAYLNSIGAEGYPVYVYGGLNQLISLLRARKVFQQTNMLLITDLGGVIKGPGYLRGSVKDFDDLKNKFGIGTSIIRFKELSDERDRILKNKSQMKEVENLADKLVGNAQKVHMDSKIFSENILFYYTIKSLLKKHNCNAYSIDCQEFCSTRLPEAWKITPCISFSLLNSEGYPTACEGEIGCLLAMNLLGAISKKSPYLGNLNPYRQSFYDPDKYLWIRGQDRQKVNFSFGHNVPGLKMLGYDTPDLPYEIRNFVPACEECDRPAWGASLKINFTNIEENTITIGRFNPLTTKLLITKADVIGMRGFDMERCSTEMLIHIRDPECFHLKTADFGHHFVGVYGDYIQDIIHLGNMLNIEIELHNT